MGDNRSIAYQEGDVSVYRASGVGSCLTALVASKMGHEEARSEYVSNILSSAAREGNLHEDAITDLLRDEHGWRVVGGQREVEMRVIRNVIIRGHIDGICKPPKMKKERILEVKTMSRDRFKKWMSMGPDARTRLMSEDFETYGWQISAYMHQLGMPAMYVVKNRDSGVLDISEIALAPIDLKTMKKKIIQAEMWFKRGQIPPCTSTSPGKFFCPFPYLHDDSPFGDEPDDEEPPATSATEALITSMAEHYVDLARKVAQLRPLDNERKDVGGKILEAIGGPDGRKVVEIGGFKIARVDNTRKSTDNAAVADELGMGLEEYEELLDRHQQTRTFPYVKVTKQGDK